MVKFTLKWYYTLLLWLEARILRIERKLSGLEKIEILMLRDRLASRERQAKSELAWELLTLIERTPDHLVKTVVEKHLVGKFDAPSKHEKELADGIEKMRREYDESLSSMRAKKA